jgi:hypothetical protein
VALGVVLTLAALWQKAGRPWPPHAGVAERSVPLVDGTAPGGPYARAGERMITPEDDAAWERRVTERLEAGGRRHLGDQ